MKITLCDVCELQNKETYVVEVDDGEHPHSGSSMTKKIDVCPHCLRNIKLRSNMSLHQLQQEKIERDRKQGTLK